MCLGTQSVGHSARIVISLSTVTFLTQYRTSCNSSVTMTLELVVILLKKKRIFGHTVGTLIICEIVIMPSAFPTEGVASILITHKIPFNTCKKGICFVFYLRDE